MKLAVEEIESVINYLSNALTFAKEARHVAKKVHGDDREVSFHLAIAYGDIERAAKILGQKDSKSRDGWVRDADGTV